MSGQTDYGKGDVYRKVDLKKWNVGWLRAFGVKCMKCKGTGRFQTANTAITGPCPKCGGIGYVEKSRKD